MDHQIGAGYFRVLDRHYNRAQIVYMGALNDTLTVVGTDNMTIATNIAFDEVDDPTGTPFASFVALQNAVKAFFPEASGGGGVTEEQLNDGLALKIDTTQKGVANGVAPLNASTKIDATYLPSYVDDVIEVANFAALPGTGETSKIYVTLDTNLAYRWSGSAYVEVSPTNPNTVLQGGNSFNAVMTTGTIDAFEYRMKAGNQDKIAIVATTNAYRMYNAGSSSYGVLDFGFTSTGPYIARNRSTAEAVLRLRNESQTSTGSCLEIESNTGGTVTLKASIKKDGTLNLLSNKTFADNAAALTGGLVAGDVYRTSTGQAMIVY